MPERKETLRERLIRVEFMGQSPETFEPLLVKVSFRQRLFERIDAGIKRYSHAFLGGCTGLLLSNFGIAAFGITPGTREAYFAVIASTIASAAAFDYFGHRPTHQRLTPR